MCGRKVYPIRTSLIRIKVICIGTRSNVDTPIICFGVRTEKKTRGPSENVNKTQDCDIWNFKTKNFIIFIQFYSSKLYAYGRKNIE